MCQDNGSNGLLYLCFVFGQTFGDHPSHSTPGGISDWVSLFWLCEVGGRASMASKRRCTMITL